MCAAAKASSPPSDEARKAAAFGVAPLALTDWLQVACVGVGRLSKESSHTDGPRHGSLLKAES